MGHLGLGLQLWAVDLRGDVLVTRRCDDALGLGDRAWSNVVAAGRPRTLRAAQVALLALATFARRARRIASPGPPCDESHLQSPGRTRPGGCDRGGDAAHLAGRGPSERPATRTHRASRRRRHL